MPQSRLPLAGGRRTSTTEQPCSRCDEPIMPGQRYDFTSYIEGSDYVEERCHVNCASNVRYGKAHKVKAT